MLKHSISFSGMLPGRQKSTDRLDVLSLTSGCSEDDAATPSRRNKKALRSNDDDDNLLLYQLEGGLFGARKEDGDGREYLKFVDTQISASLSSDTTATTATSMTSSSSSDRSTSPSTRKDIIDVDEYLWST